LKLLLDEMLDHEIAIQLCSRGCDAESIQAQHQRLKATDDYIVLEEAGRLGRTLVTDNVPHFLAAHSRLMAEGKHHAGLLLASSRAYPRSKRTIGLWVRVLTDVVLDHKDRSTEDLITWLP
jgi:Domain of unknown function (DUF5615)